MAHNEYTEVNFGKVCPYLRSINIDVLPPLLNDLDTNTCDFTICPLGKKLIQPTILFASSVNPLKVVQNLYCEGCEFQTGGFRTNVELEIKSLATLVKR